MFSKGFRISLLLLYVASGGTVAVIVRLENGRLQKRLAAETQQRQRAELLRRDIEQARSLLARTGRNGIETDRALQNDLLRWQGVVAELEQRARARHDARQVQAEIDAGGLDRNRDPEKGLTRLEHFHDAGRATPAAAFQTFVWAAMSGEEPRLAELIAFSGDGRQKAEAVVAALPDADRSRYATPEKLAALFFADTFTTMQAGEVVGVSMTDSQHALVRVRGLTLREQGIPMELGPGGWRVAVTGDMAAKLGGWARAKPGPPQGG